MFGPRSSRSSRFNIIKCTGCKKTIKSEICRIPTKYQRILPLIQYLRPEATMKSLFCTECYKKVLHRWNQSRQKRQAVTSSLSSIDSTAIVTSSEQFLGSQDKLDSSSGAHSSWNKAAHDELKEKLLTLNSEHSSKSSTSSSTTFFSNNSANMVQNRIVSSTEEQPTSKLPSPTVSYSCSERNSESDNEEVIEILTEAVSEGVERNVFPIEKNLTTEPIQLEVLSESSDESNYIPPRQKKPRVRIRQRHDEPPDPNKDINFHERFNGG